MAQGAEQRQALEACDRLRFRPESALTRLQLAELLLDHYQDEPGEATEHLDSAIREFREMKMQPPLERALARQQSSRISWKPPSAAVS